MEIDLNLRRYTLPKSLEPHPLLPEARNHRELFHQNAAETVLAELSEFLGRI